MCYIYCFFFFFFSSRRRHTRLQGDWSSDVYSSDLAAAVGARAHPLAFHVEGIVVLYPGEVGAAEARADLEAFACGQAEHGLGEIGFQAVEDRLAPPRWAATDGAGDDAAERVALFTGRLDGGDHALGNVGIGAADDVGVDVVTGDALDIGLGGEAPHFGDPGDDLDAVRVGQEL